MPTLKCFAVLCHQNDAVSQAVASGVWGMQPVPLLVMKLMSHLVFIKVFFFCSNLSCVCKPSRSFSYTELKSHQGICSHHLHFVSNVCRKSSLELLSSATYNGDPIPKLLIHLLARDKTSEMQMAAAKCMTYLYRGSAIEASNTIITLKVPSRASCKEWILFHISSTCIWVLLYGHCSYMVVMMRVCQDVGYLSLNVLCLM